MATVVKMPKMGINMEEGVLVEFFAREGDSIRKGEKLFSIETDKSTMEIEAPEDGVLLKIIGKEEEEYPCGTVLAVIGEQGEDISGLV